MCFYIIVCHTKNRVIGKGGKMPWHISEDLKRFKKITLKHPTVVMGRKTFESLPYGRPLPERKNIVLSRSQVALEGCEVVASPQEVFSRYANGKCCFVIGGEQIYRQFLPLATRIYRTLLETEMEGDAFFPEINESEWEVTESKPCQSEEDFPIHFEVLQRADQAQSI